MSPLSLIPFAVTIPSLGIMAIGLALMTRDGLMALVGYGFAAGTLWTASTAL